MHIGIMYDVLAVLEVALPDETRLGAVNFQFNKLSVRVTPVLSPSTGETVAPAGADNTIRRLIDAFTAAGWGLGTQLDPETGLYTAAHFNHPSTLTRF